jgi:hypothetical protein
MSFSRKFSAEALSIAGGLVIIGFLLRLSYDAAIVAAAVACFIIGAVFRPRRLVGWIPALVVSLTWIAISGDMYAGYNVFKLHILGITAFPIIAWPTALAFAYLYLVPLVQAKPWPRRWLYLAAVYSVGIIAAEWLGYHLLGLSRLADTGHLPLPVVDAAGLFRQRHGLHGNGVMDGTKAGPPRADPYGRGVVAANEGRIRNGNGLLARPSRRGRRQGRGTRPGRPR